MNEIQPNGKERSTLASAVRGSDAEWRPKNDGNPQICQQMALSYPALDLDEYHLMQIVP